MVSKVRGVGFVILMLSAIVFGQAKKPAPTIAVAVDATNTPRKIFHATLKIPASAGTLTLYYPKWIPGEHGPTGPVQNLTGLKFSAGGQTLPVASRFERRMDAARRSARRHKLKSRRTSISCLRAAKGSIPRAARPPRR